MKELSLSHDLNRTETYAFFCGCYLYGLYRLKARGKRCHYLVKNSYQPLKILGVGGKLEKNIINTHSLLSNPEKLLALLKKQNEVKRTLFIKIIRKNESTFGQYYLQFFNHSWLQLIENHLIDEKHLLPVLNALQKKIMSSSLTQLSLLTKLGRDLFNLVFPSRLRPLLSQVNQFVLYAPDFTYLHLASCYGEDKGNRFFLLGNTTYHASSRVSQKVYKVRSFQMITSLEDVTMQQEQNEIHKVFTQKKYFSNKFLNLESSLGNGDIKQRTDMVNRAIIDSDWIHLAFHSRKELTHSEETRKETGLVLLHQDKAFYTIEDFEQLVKAPRVLLISGCHSDDGRLIKWFFKAGGQTMMVSEGPLFSQNFSELIGKFYWRLLFQKVTVAKAYQNLIKELAFRDDITAVKFKLYGSGRERLSSF